MLGIFEIDALRDASGNAVVVTGADVEVRNEATGALVALYEDADGNTPLDNPFTAAGSTIKFYCDTSLRFRVDIESGAFSRTLRHRAAQEAVGVEYGEFMPTITCATPGDLSVAYSTQQGYWQRSGRVMHYSMTMSFTPTFTTASGDLRISPESGYDPVISTPGVVSLNVFNYRGSGRTAPFILRQPSYFILRAQGDGVSGNTTGATIRAEEIESGVTQSVFASGSYIIGSV